MGVLYDEISWLEDGQTGSADYLNAPLKQLVRKLDNYEYTNNTIPIADIDLNADVVNDDFVYRYENPNQTGEYLYGMNKGKLRGKY